MGKALLYLSLVCGFLVGHYENRMLNWTGLWPDQQDSCHRLIFWKGMVLFHSSWITWTLKRKQHNKPPLQRFLYFLWPCPHAAGGGNEISSGLPNLPREPKSAVSFLVIYNLLGSKKCWNNLAWSNCFPRRLHKDMNWIEDVMRITKLILLARAAAE